MSCASSPDSRFRPRAGNPASCPLACAATGATVGFNSLVAGQLLYALACTPRGRLPGSALTGTLAGSFAAQLMALFLPGLRHIAGSRLGAADLALSAAAGLGPLLAIGALDPARQSAQPIS